MNKRVSPRVLLALGLAALMMGADEKPAADALPKPDSDGFVSLFDGKTLDGWHGLEGFWSVKDGAITGEESKEHPAPQTFLVYHRPFGDFELRFKYKFVSQAGNSGVQFRSKVIDEKTSRVGGYQADMDADRGYDGTIYDEAGVAGGRGTMGPRGKKIIYKADGSRQEEDLDKNSEQLKETIKAHEWNDYVVIAKGNHLELFINGNKTTEVIDDNPHALKEGVLALQLHAGFVMEVQFKEIKIKPL